jgi:hypothetical protein
MFVRSLGKTFITMLHKIVTVCDLVLAVILRMIMQHFCYSGSCVDYSSVIDAERSWRCVITFSGFDSPDSLYELLLCQNLCNCGKLVLLSQLPPPAKNNNRSFQSLKDPKVFVIFSSVCVFFFGGQVAFPQASLCCVVLSGIASSQLGSSGTAAALWFAFSHHWQWLTAASRFLNCWEEEKSSGNVMSLGWITQQWLFNKVSCNLSHNAIGKLALSF